MKTCGICGEMSEYPKSDGDVCTKCKKWTCNECGRLRTDCPACGTEFEKAGPEAWRQAIPVKCCRQGFGPRIEPLPVPAEKGSPAARAYYFLELATETGGLPDDLCLAVEAIMDDLRHLGMTEAEVEAANLRTASPPDEGRSRPK